MRSESVTCLVSESEENSFEQPRTGAPLGVSCFDLFGIFYFDYDNTFRNITY